MSAGIGSRTDVLGSTLEEPADRIPATGHVPWTVERVIQPMLAGHMIEKAVINADATTSLMQLECLLVPSTEAVQGGQGHAVGKGDAFPGLTTD